MKKPRYAVVLEALKGLRSYSDQDIANQTSGQITRSKVERLRRGAQTWSLDDAEILAAALDVDPTVWFMEPAEAVQHAAATWGAEWPLRTGWFPALSALSVATPALTA